MFEVEHFNPVNLITLHRILNYTSWFTQKIMFISHHNWSTWKVNWKKIEEFIEINALEGQFYLLNDNICRAQNAEHFEITSRCSPPHIPEQKDLKNYMISLAQRTNLRKTSIGFHQIQTIDIRSIHSSIDNIVTIDKTRNMNKVSHE